MSKPDFNKMTADLVAGDSFSTVPMYFTDVENTLEAAYAAGLERAAEIAEEIGRSSFAPTGSGIAAAIREEKEKV